MIACFQVNQSIADVVARTSAAFRRRYEYYSGLSASICHDNLRLDINREVNRMRPYIQESWPSGLVRVTSSARITVVN